MRKDIEDTDTYWNRAKEAEAYVARIRGPRPDRNEVTDMILAAMLGGGAAMLALALAGVGGSRFEYITLLVSGIFGAVNFLNGRHRDNSWHRAWMKRMDETAPRPIELARRS